MKKIMGICMGLIAFQIAAFTQCGVNHRELLDKYCNGVYLHHQELGNVPNGKITLLLKKDDRYAIYLLNPSRMLPDFDLAGSKSAELKDVVSQVNRTEKISTYIFTAGESGEYDFNYSFNSSEDACVLMAIYLQNINIFKPGVYSDFDQMKYNNPSGPVGNKITSRIVRLSGHQQVTYFNLKSEAKEPGKPFGFSDGRSLYIKRREGLGLDNDFAKINNFGKYGFFEDIAHSSVGSAAYSFLTLNLIDMNTGEIKRVNKKNMAEILVDNPVLLESFNKEPQKDKKLKDYLTSYLTSRCDPIFNGSLSDGDYTGKKEAPPYKVTRTMSYTRYSITPVSKAVDDIRIRFYRAGAEQDVNPLITYTSGSEYHSGSLFGIQNPTFPIDVKIKFRAPHYFEPSETYLVIFEFTIYEPGTWNVAISY